MNLQAKTLLIDHNILKIAPTFLKSVFYMVGIFIFYLNQNYICNIINDICNGQSGSFPPQ